MSQSKRPVLGILFLGAALAFWFVVAHVASLIKKPSVTDNKPASGAQPVAAAEPDKEAERRWQWVREAKEEEVRLGAMANQLAAQADITFGKSFFFEDAEQLTVDPSGKECVALNLPSAYRVGVRADAIRDYLLSVGYDPAEVEDVVRQGGTQNERDLRVAMRHAGGYVPATFGQLWGYLAAHKADPAPAMLILPVPYGYGALTAMMDNESCVSDPECRRFLNTALDKGIDTLYVGVKSDGTSKVVEEIPMGHTDQQWPANARLLGCKPSKN